MGHAKAIVVSARKREAIKVLLKARRPDLANALARQESRQEVPIRRRSFFAVTAAGSPTRQEAEELVRLYADKLQNDKPGIPFKLRDKAYVAFQRVLDKLAGKYKDMDLESRVFWTELDKRAKHLLQTQPEKLAASVEVKAAEERWQYNFIGGDASVVLQVQVIAAENDGWRAEAGLSEGGKTPENTRFPLMKSEWYKSFTAAVNAAKGLARKYKVPWKPRHYITDKAHKPGTPPPENPVASVKRDIIATLIKFERPDLASAVSKAVIAYDSEEDFEDQDEVSNRPEEEDYTIVDKPMGKYQVGQVGGKHLGQFSEMDDAVNAIMKKMDKEQFWSNVWFIDDHGGHSLMTIKKKGSKYTYTY